MPVVRPLRERCNVKLSVTTSITTPVDDANILAYDVSRSRRRHHRQAKRVFKPSFLDEDSSSSSSPIRAHADPENELQSLHELVPYLFLAFSDGNYSPSVLRTDAGKSFTHIIKITRPSDGDKGGKASVTTDDKTGIHTLHLTLPRFMPPNVGREWMRTRHVRDVTLLSDYQLLLARDFVSLALPYYSLARPNEHRPPSADGARLLISAPPGSGSAADIMAIVVCYLVFVSEEDAGTVLDYIDDEEEVPEEWKGAIGVDEGGVEFIDRIANLGM